MSVHRWLTHTHSKLHHCYSSLPRYTKQPLVTLGCTYLPSKWKPIRGAHPVHACPAKRVRCRWWRKTLLVGGIPHADQNTAKHPNPTSSISPGASETAVHRCRMKEGRSRHRRTSTHPGWWQSASLSRTLPPDAASASPLTVALDRKHTYKPAG